MGRHLQRKHSGVLFEENQPGCMWGILDYHHWHNVKKMDPHKKHQRGRHPRCWRNPKTLSIDHVSDEVQELLDAEADHFQVEQHTAKTSPTNKSSAKARIKALITKEMSKGENHKHWILGFPERSQLRRTDSLHHLEPSDHRLGGLSTGWTNPIIILRKNADTSATRLQVPSLSTTPGELVASSNNQKKMNAKQLIRGVSLHQVKEYVDVLEIYKVNKDLFLKILQDPDVGFSKNFPGQQTSNTKVKLTKSGSFPVADSSRVRYLRPVTLEHKQNEVWSFPKGEKLLADCQVPKFDASKSQKDHCVESMPSLADDNSGNAIKQETSLSSQVSSHGLHKHWWNQLVINHLKDIKQRIKHALKESKKRSNHTSMDALLQVPSGSTDGKEMSERLKTITMAQDGVDNLRSCDGTDDSDHDRSTGRLQRVRRTASLNESLDRYVQLFECSFSKEAKLDHSRSLKLISEDKISSKGRAPRFSRRISSLSDLESFCSLLNEVSRDAFCSEMPIRTVMDCNTITEIDSHSEQKLVSIPVETDNFEPLEAIVETEVHEVTLVDRNHEGIAKTADLSKDKVEPAIGEICCRQEQEISFAMNPSREVAEPSSASVTEACFQDDITNPVELPISEGSGLNSRCLHIDEPDCFINSQNRSNTDSLPRFCSTVNHENVECTSKRVDHHFLHNNLNEMGDSNFNYVRDVLERSGFMGNEYLATWHSIDQPLNPSLFKELEAYLPYELQCSGEENGSNCYHQLLFDLVNGALLEIYDKSYTYFPKAFSFSRRICPMPKGHHVLEDVWSRVSWYLNSRPELDQSLDDIVGRDMAKGDGWMNLQLEAECVALDLEELIFDELLDEVICS